MRNFKIGLVLAFFLAGPLSYAMDQESGGTGDGGTAASIFKVSENNNYADNLALRGERKIGLAGLVGGAVGLLGLNIEINFEDINGALVSVGGGDGYRAVNIAWKHVFPGDTIAPYTTLGFAHWNDNGRVNYKNSGVLERVLNQEEKNSGKFTADFISGAVGLQYTHLNGSLAGASLFAEVVLLGDLESATLVPTGAVGAGYYF